MGESRTPLQPLQSVVGYSYAINKTFNLLECQNYTTSNGFI